MTIGDIEILRQHRKLVPIASEAEDTKPVASAEFSRSSATLAQVSAVESGSIDTAAVLDNTSKACAQLELENALLSNQIVELHRQLSLLNARVSSSTAPKEGKSISESAEAGVDASINASHSSQQYRFVDTSLGEMSISAQTNDRSLSAVNISSGDTVNIAQVCPQFNDHEDVGCLNISLIRRFHFEILRREI